MSLSKVKMKAKVRNRYNQVPHMTQDIVWEGDINTIKHPHMTQDTVWEGDINTIKHPHMTQDTVWEGDMNTIKHPHMTQDTVWEGDMNTLKHHIQGSQEVSPCPIGDHKSANKRHDRQDTLNPA